MERDTQGASTIAGRFVSLSCMMFIWLLCNVYVPRLTNLGLDPSATYDAVHHSFLLEMLSSLQMLFLDPTKESLR